MQGRCIFFLAYFKKKLYLCGRKGFWANLGGFNYFTSALIIVFEF